MMTDGNAHAQHHETGGKMKWNFSLNYFMVLKTEDDFA